MKISFVITLYNREKTIVRCLKSITKNFENYLENLEIVIVDDDSSDNSVLEARNYLKKYNFSYFIEKNINNFGSNYSKDKGIKKSNGLWSVLLDSDDELCINYLELKKYFQQFSNYKFISFKCKNIHGKKIGNQKEEILFYNFKYYINNFHKVDEKLDCIKKDECKLSKNCFFDINIHLGCEFLSWAELFRLNGSNVIINKIARVYHSDSNNQITSISKRKRANDYYYSYKNFFRKYYNELDYSMIFRLFIRIFIYKMLK